MSIGPEEDAAFEEWLIAEGDSLAESIRESMKESSELMSLEQGSHAVWHEGDLGMLILLPFEHVMAFAQENLSGDFARSPVHNYVFSMVTELLMKATELTSDIYKFEVDDDDSPF
jgi:hypothetical protein